MSKGKVGEHDEFSPELSDDAIRWIDKSMKGVDNIKFSAKK